VTSPERSAGVKKPGWRFYVPVYLGIVGGVLLILAIEAASSAHVIPDIVHDVGLIIGGMLIGQFALWINELYRVEPERQRMEALRKSELQRHQEERRLDFEQYRALQAELREARTRASSLQARLDLTGALDRDRVGDALLLGFYFNRRGEGLPSAPNQSIFSTAALRLKLLTDKITDVKLDKDALQDVLEIAYGPLVSEAFDLGYLLSHLGEDGISEAQAPELLSELEQHLRALKIDTKLGKGSDSWQEPSSFFRKLAARVVSLIRRQL
jgi:hypothetical protein